MTAPWRKMFEKRQAIALRLKGKFPIVNGETIQSLAVHTSNNAVSVNVTEKEPPKPPPDEDESKPPIKEPPTEEPPVKEPPPKNS